MSIRNEKLAARAAADLRKQLTALEADNAKLKAQVATLAADNAKLAAELKSSKTKKSTTSSATAFLDE